MSDNSNTDMPMTPVVSSNIAAIGTEGRDLLIEFRSGATYRYPGMADHAGEIMTSSSPGGYVFRHLKDRGIKE